LIHDITNYITAINLKAYIDTSIPIKLTVQLIHEYLVCQAVVEMQQSNGVECESKAEQGIKKKSKVIIVKGMDQMTTKSKRTSFYS